jgi:single-stranded-DNA-specific exonuclease
MMIPYPNADTEWAVNPCSWKEAEALAASLGVPMVAAMVMAGRGLTDADSARAFVEGHLPVPDPFLFHAMEAVVDTLDGAIASGRKIVVHGDYDADGITATALLLEVLGGQGADVDWYLPNRFEEGYGLSSHAVEAIVARGANILVTVDCGVNYPDEVAFARELGLEVIVVDHHQPGVRLPECHLIHHVNSDYPHADLCGVGLALKVMHALYAKRFGTGSDDLPGDLADKLDLVALGTIADLAPLLGENRRYVKEGLRLMNLGERVGVRALARLAGCSGAVDSGAVAFRLAPRLNAAGRVADASPPLRLLLTADPDEAESLATELHELNSARQELERRVFDEAVSQVEACDGLPVVLVLGAEEWHEGVLGIVAARLVERYQRPTVLLNIGENAAKGSGRSIPAYDLHEGLTDCQHLLTVYGGHAQAAGLTLDPGMVDDLREALESHASTVLSAQDLMPKYRADAIARGEELNPDTARALADLEPFGVGNPRPRLLLVDSRITDVEPTRNGLHLRCRIGQDGVKVSGIGFGMGREGQEIPLDARPGLVGGQLRLDEWRGAERVQFLLERLGETASPRASLGACDETCPEAAMPSRVDVQSDPSSQPPGGKALDKRDWPPPCRDLRDKPGQLSALAQVLATGEVVLVLACSVHHALARLAERIPLDVLVGEDLVCVNGSCVNTAARRLRSSRVIMAEWDSASLITDSLPALAHAIAIDPPFRAGHVAVLRSLGQGATDLHLVYGEDERAKCAALLRHMVHPRFAMVCVYRTMQARAGDANQLLAKAAALAREERGVTLSLSDLERAHGILRELGLERPTSGKAKLEARSTAAYREAEAEYEECLRHCLTL